MVFVPLAAIICNMKRGGKMRFCVLTLGVLSGASAIAATSADADAPYGAIVERNVFNLHAPPPPVNPADLIKKIPPPKIILTGIMTLSGQKKTFLTIPSPKPGAPPESVILAEGQRQNGIEVKRIDEKAGVVEVMNHDESQTLDFEHDGAKPSGMVAGGLPQPMPLPLPAPPPPNVTPMPGNVIRPLRSLSPRSDTSGVGGAVGSANENAQAQSQLTPEEQVALIEIQRVKYQQERNPISKIFPRTELTPETTGGQLPSGF